MTGAVRVLEHHLTVYRRTWKGSMFVSFASPILFLAAIGVGLGSLIARGPVHTVGGVSYLTFLAPGLLAATAMQTAFVETTYPVMAKIQWLRTYDGMLATPITVRAVLGGEIGWLVIRLATSAFAFFLVMLIFGTVHSALALLMIPVVVLNGLAFGAPIFAFTPPSVRTKPFPRSAVSSSRRCSYSVASSSRFSNCRRWLRQSPGLPHSRIAWSCLAAWPSVA